MRVAFVVQRCGADVNGGAESLCLQVAQKMQAHWTIDVLTTCALDYVRWENYYPPGTEMVGGVPIRRFAVDSPRDPAHFDALSSKLVHEGRSATLTEQKRWMHAQGPNSSSLLDFIECGRDAYDAFVFFGYLYATTYHGLPLVKEKAWLVPLAHDEWTIHLSMWDDFFALPQGYIFQTPEELAFLRTRFPTVQLRGPVAALGVNAPDSLEPERFRSRYDLTEPFILYLGRVDSSKGCDEMFEWFMRRAATEQTVEKLVVIGREAVTVPFHDRIIYLDFVSEREKWDAMAACDWLLLPSPYESLSLSLLETWMAGQPAIVNGRSEVLRGHCRRAHGGLWYRSWLEVNAILRQVDPETRRILARQGQAYVLANYRWERVENDYLNAIQP